MNAFKMIDPNKLDKEGLEAYGVASRYFDEMESAQ